MSSVYGIALSGLQDAALRLEVSAHNRANAETRGFVPRQVESTATPQGGVASRIVPQTNPEFDSKVDETTLAFSGTNFVDETVGSMVAVISYKANLASLETAAQLDRALMNVKA